MAVTRDRPAAGRVAEVILGFLSEIPTTSEPLNPSPKDRAVQIARCGRAQGLHDLRSARSSSRARGPRHDTA